MQNTKDTNMMFFNKNILKYFPQLSDSVELSWMAETLGMVLPALETAIKVATNDIERKKLVNARALIEEVVDNHVNIV